jgi:hypothetical protein
MCKRLLELAIFLPMRLEILIRCNLLVSFEIVWPGLGILKRFRCSYLFILFCLDTPAAEGYSIVDMVDKG